LRLGAIPKITVLQDHDYCLPETNAIFTRRDELETNLESLKKKNKLLHTTVHNLRKSKSTLETNVNKLKEALKNVKSELSEKAYRTICDILPGDEEDLQLGDDKDPLLLDEDLLLGGLGDEEDLLQRDEEDLVLGDEEIKEEDNIEENNKEKSWTGNFIDDDRTQEIVLNSEYIIKEEDVEYVIGPS